MNEAIKKLTNPDREDGYDKIALGYCMALVNQVLDGSEITKTQAKTFHVFKGYLVSPIYEVPMGALRDLK